MSDDSKAEGASSFEKNKAALIRLFGNAHNGTFDNLLRASAEITKYHQTDDKDVAQIDAQIGSLICADTGVDAHRNDESATPSLTGPIFNTIKTCRDGRKWTCLHFASAGGNRPVVESILGVDPTLAVSVDVDGLTPLMIAARHAELGICQAILSSLRSDELKLEMLSKVAIKDGRSVVHYAVQSGNIEIIKIILDAGANVSTVGSTCNSAFPSGFH